MNFYKNIKYCEMGDNICIHSYLKELDEIDKIKYKIIIENDKDSDSIRKYGQLEKDDINYILIKFKKRYRRDYKFIKITENNNKYINDFFLTEYENIDRYGNEFIFKIMKHIIRHPFITYTN